jgi:hypothetical protein
MLGHASVAMTLVVYAHLIPSMESDAADGSPPCAAPGKERFTGACLPRWPTLLRQRPSGAHTTMTPRFLQPRTCTFATTVEPVGGPLTAKAELVHKGRRLLSCECVIEDFAEPSSGAFHSDLHDCSSAVGSKRAGHRIQTETVTGCPW